ncbi:HlyD family efflux transporter periplasmic adaptor subunit [bacterium]|nr:HlyD family efflux transporter periplasmic adaptor subunit [bacterium]
MKFAKVIAIVLVISVLGLLTYMTEKKRQEENSVLSGIFENQPTLAASRTSGRVLEITAQEGTPVHKGDLLLKLDPGPLVTDMKVLESQLRESEANLKKLRKGYRQEEILAQQAAVNELRANLEKLRNGNRPEDIAAAQAASEQAYANWQKLKNGCRPEELAAAKAKLEGAEAALAQAAQEDSRYAHLYQCGAISQQTSERTHEAHLVALAVRDSLLNNYNELKNGSRSEDIQAAEAAYRQASEHFNLMKAGSRSEDIDMAAQKLEQAKQVLKIYKEGCRQEDIAAAEAAVSTKKLQLQSAQEKLREYKVYSPIDGIVDKELVSVGDLTNAGQSLIRISNTEDIWIKVYLPQKDLGLIKAGDKATLHVDSLGTENIEAQIDSIASQGEYTPVNLQTPDERAQQVYAVKLRLTKPDARVKPGMSACVKSMGEWNDSL